MRGVFSTGVLDALPEGTRIVEINPPENFLVKRLTKDISILQQGYCYGYDAGIKIMKRWYQKNER